MFAWNKHDDDDCIWLTCIMVYVYVILQSFLIIAYLSLFRDACFAWVYEVYVYYNTVSVSTMF